MKTCFYEVLGVPSTATDEDIKQGYRKLALRWHPDKNRDNPDATAVFQGLQEAYATLSDPQERAWYDGHKNQILRGDADVEGGDDPSGINLYRYFTRDAHKGMHDAPNGFYQTYAALFEELITAENTYGNCTEPRVAPVFGNSRSSPQAVMKFYQWWGQFSTFRAMNHAEVWNLSEASNRYVRKAMEKENQEERNKARKELNYTVRELTYFLKKRDPRMKDVMLHQAQEKQRKAEEADARKKQLEDQKKQARDRRRLQAESVLAQLEREKEDAIARGQAFYDEESESEEVTEVYDCEICRKTFKSENQLLNHTKTKKHQQQVRKAVATLPPADLPPTKTESSEAASDKSDPIDTAPLTISVEFENEMLTFDTSDAESCHSSEFRQLLSSGSQMATRCVDEACSSCESSSRDYNSESDTEEAFVNHFMHRKK